MKTCLYDINDVLIIMYKGVDRVARVSGYVDQLDDTQPLYVNLRSIDDNRWYRRNIRIQPSQIKRADKEWYERREKEWQSELKARCDAEWKKMSDAQKKIVHEQYQQLFGENPRSPINMMIDRACGLE